MKKFQFVPICLLLSGKQTKLFLCPDDFFMMNIFRLKKDNGISPLTRQRISFFNLVTIKNDLLIAFGKKSKNNLRDKIYDLNGFDQDGINKVGFDFHGYDRNGYNTEGFKRNNQFIDDEGRVKHSIRVNLCNIFDAIEVNRDSDEIMKECVGLNPNTFKKLLKDRT